MVAYGAAPLDKRTALEYHLGGRKYNHPHVPPFGISAKMGLFPHYPSVFRSNRKRFNACGIMLSIIVPWLLFCMIFGIFSFTTYYYSPFAAWVTTFLLGLLTVGCSTCCIWWIRIRREHSEHDHDAAEPMWFGFLMLSCVFAIVAGIGLGFYIQEVYMKTAYDLEHLATYQDINPGDYIGSQLVDAGRITFSEKSYVDQSKSSGFKDKDMYCVAPIVSPKMKKNPEVTYDFWAVGKNCCSGTAADFRCTGWSDHGLKKVGGLRLLNDDLRPFYRLAVQQAEATHVFNAQKPLFFTWEKDPIAYPDSLKQSGLTVYVVATITAFFVQCFVVISATLTFARYLPMRCEEPHH